MKKLHFQKILHEKVLYYFFLQLKLFCCPYCSVRWLGGLTRLTSAAAEEGQLGTGLFSV